MLGFNRRFDPNHAALCEEVRRGEVGNLEIIQMTSRGPSLPAISYLAASGGQLRTNGSFLRPVALDPQR